MVTAATPLPVSPSADDGLALRYYDVTSTDGTRLRAWTNDVDGPTVLLCNGLGTNPFAWPALLDPDCGVRVISWNHRGTGGSERPADPEAVGVEPFVDDAIAVLDDAGVDACVLMGWSIGVNTMFETAVEHPDRVTGLFAVGGVPGDTFASMGAPMLIPRPFRKPIAVNMARVMKLAGKPLHEIGHRLPIGPITYEVLTHTGFMMPTPDPVNDAAGGQGVPDHPDRLVHAPRPALLACTCGSRCAPSRCRRASSPASSTSSPRRTT